MRRLLDLTVARYADPIRTNSGREREVCWRFGDHLPLSLVPVISYISSPSSLAPRVSETLPKELLAALGASPKPSYSFIAPGDLTKFDAFIFDVPTRYGNFSMQWKNFWDASGALWASGLGVRLDRIPR